MKNIFIDLDDTILDFKKAEQIAVSKTLEHFGIKATQENVDRYHELNAMHWKQLEKGLITRSQVKIGRFKSLLAELSVSNPIANDLDPRELAKYYEHALSIGHYFINGAEDFLKTASKRYNLYLVSNGTASVQKGRIKSAKIGKYFKKIYVSEDIGYNKPSKEYFHYCFADILGQSQSTCTDDRLSALKMVKDETVIIGDSLTSDILGGNNAEIRTVWFNPNGLENTEGVNPDFEIKRFSEFYTKVLPRL